MGLIKDGFSVLADGHFKTVLEKLLLVMSAFGGGFQDDLFSMG
jgi:hypothetical protein